MKLISLCPSNTEMLAYLGRADWLIAVDDYSDWPASVHSLPRVGPDLHIDMERVEALNPDLVLASLSVPGMERNIEELKKRNIPHLIFQPHSLKEIADDLLRLGEAIGEKERAEAVVKRYRDVIAQYTQLAKKIDQPPTIYWEWWPKPVFTPGKTNWLSEISELAGGRNVFADIEQANVQTDWEEVSRRNPDYIALVWVGVRSEKIDPSLVKKRPGWNELQAVQSNRIYVLEEALFCRPSPRLLLGLKKLASLLYSDIFPTYDEVDPVL
ncbi:iron complex transport system substrate-binding protein [Anoxybacillus voinovskiensis]|uniref:Iron complex transport system substrate-binding protein n=1 Tax=Anoxybacteroides voinovskiense TaxID=230470 RepID=A0A840DQK7_9BACL|nr:cobalamin-binding protein [Anoxybacillus voinovskiensis]MBB4075421.1 iron complex transport system substrate-binding protein [Anoxybacillus voinovskiensis]GGJ78590.1 cobalamin-binding protein [Anoxybacillus voinovskiensis]